MSYTDALISKKAMEFAEQELRSFRSWSRDNGHLNEEIRGYLRSRINSYGDLIEEKAYSLEQLRRDSEVTPARVKTREGVMISDHAIVRYMQRGLGIDIKELAKEIVPKDRAPAIKGIVSGRVVIGNLVLVFKDTTIITILTKGQARRHRLKPIEERKKVKRTAKAKMKRRNR